MIWSREQRWEVRDQREQRWEDIPMIYVRVLSNWKFEVDLGIGRCFTEGLEGVHLPNVVAGHPDLQKISLISR